MFLELRESHEHVDLFLSGEVFLHIGLEASDHERAEKPMDLSDNLLLRIPIVFHGEEVFEVLGRVEELGHQKVQKGPQFFQVVLQRGTCQQDAMRSTKLPQNLREYTLIIFDPLGFVKNEKIKLMLLEFVLLLHDSFECGDHDIILAVSDCLFLNVPLFSVPIEAEHSD